MGTSAIYQADSKVTAVKAKPNIGLVEYLLFGQIVAATFLQKLALPIGNGSVYLSLPIMLALSAVGLLSGRLKISSLLLAFYLFVIAALGITQLFAVTFSLSSFALLCLFGTNYVFYLKSETARPNAELLFFQKCMLLLAVLGITQYFMQFVIGARFAFFMEHDFPQQLIVQGFHGLNPVGYGSGTYKSNGVFFLEPSIFCQFLAIALIIEMLYFRKLVRIVFYLAAIAVTFSGTGLILLLVLAPVYLLMNRHFIILSCLFVALLSAGLWMPLVGLEHTYERAFEIIDPHTSGFARFISMFLIMHQYVLPDFTTTLFGMGAGSVRDYIAPGRLSYEAFSPSWGKLAFEYGFFGLTVYLAFMMTAVKKSQRSNYLKVALLLQFLFLGEFVLVPTVHGLIIALLIWPSPRMATNADEQQLKA